MLPCARVVSSMKRLVCLALAALALLPLCSSGMTSRVKDQDSLPHHGKCERITIPFCQGIAYNETIMPNLLHHQRQEDAGLEVHQFFPLVKVKCSPDLQFFLCTMYAPVCTILDRPIPPCRNLCRSSKLGCETLMMKFGFPWPENLDCDRFPESGGSEICVWDNTGNTERSGSSGGGGGPVMPVGSTHVSSGPNKPYGPMPPNQQPGKHHLPFRCPEQYRVPERLNYTLKVGDTIEKNCGAPCNRMFFSEDQTAFARRWVGGWSIVCAASCLLTVLTFTIDTDRFRYPERPIIFLSVCYLMVALAYVFGFAAGDTIACQRLDTPADPIPNLEVREPIPVLFL